MTRTVERRVDVPARSLYDFTTPILIGTPSHPLGAQGVANAIVNRAYEDARWFDMVAQDVPKEVIDIVVGTPPEAAQ